MAISVNRLRLVLTDPCNWPPSSNITSTLSTLIHSLLRIVWRRTVPSRSILQSPPFFSCKYIVPSQRSQKFLLGGSHVLLTRPGAGHIMIPDELEHRPISKQPGIQINIPISYTKTICLWGFCLESRMVHQTLAAS